MSVQVLETHGRQAGRQALHTWGEGGAHPPVPNRSSGKRYLQTPFSTLKQIPEGRRGTQTAPDLTIIISCRQLEFLLDQQGLCAPIVPRYPLLRLLDKDPHQPPEP